MSDLEAELARFEAELAAVETNQAAAEPSQQQEHGGPVPHHAPHHAQLSAPATSSGPPSAAPAVAPEPQPVQYHQTGPMYHEYNPPAQQGMQQYSMPQNMYAVDPGNGYGVDPSGYAVDPNSGYALDSSSGYYTGQAAAPGMESYAPAPTMMGATLSAAPVFTAPPMQPAADEEAVTKEEAAFKGVDYKKPGKTVKRHAGGQTWWDSSLAEWPENDFRVFVGDLGNEVNDDILSKAFQKYPSFAKGKVVRDKRSNKSKGFGFVSFLESGDYAKALREMDGKYIGNRPCKLRKSSWQERNAHARGKWEKGDKRQKTA